MPLVSKPLRYPETKNSLRSFQDQRDAKLSPCKQYLRATHGDNFRKRVCLNRFSCAIWQHFLGALARLLSRFSRGSQAVNESLEVFVARPVAARRANQAGARKGTYDNALLGEAVDKRLRLVGSPGDQGRLVRPGDYVGAMLQEQRTAALGSHARACKAVVSGLCCERERSEEPGDRRE
jgi:hypothetical protein